MTALTLEDSRKIIAAALAKGREIGLKPLAVLVLDAGGHVKAFEREDGASNLRFEIARGKAYGGLGVGMGSRGLFKRAQEQAFFVQALNGLADGKVVPVPGGVLIRKDGEIIGAVGISGDTSDNDEICALAGIEAAGFEGDTG
ncbi:MAG: heme-binding protein [Limibacillus sp.]|jgi:uncharacterized protein GlcG (DUF336 family)